MRTIVHNVVVELYFAIMNTLIITKKGFPITQKSEVAISALNLNLISCSY